MKCHSGLMSAGVQLPEAAPAQSIFSGQLRAVSAGLLIVVTMVAFEAMSVTAALPTAARELHGLGGYGWAFTGFLVSNVVAMVASGVISDRRGPRAPLTAGLALFLGGLVVAGLAEQMAQLVVGRVIQGLGSGLILTAMYVVIGEAYPADLRPKFFAALSGAWVLPSLLGPPIAGAITQHLTWRLVFLGLVPLVVLGTALTVVSLRSLPARGGSPGSVGRGRILRAFVAAVAIAELEQAGQHPRPVWLALAVPTLVALVWALRGLLPPGTARVRRGVPTAVAFRGMLAGAFFGIDSLIPLSMTVQHHYAPTPAALPLLASAMGWSTGSWLQSRYRGSARHLLVRAGFICICVGGLGTAVSAFPGGLAWVVYPAWTVAGTGMGLAMSTVGVLLLDFTTDAERGRDSSALQLADGVVSAFTTGIGGVLVAAAARGALGYTAAFVTVDLLMVAVCAVGVALSGRAQRPTPAPLPEPVPDAWPGPVPGSAPHAV
jgi:MFS family permease